ncbi:flavin-containing monooxygenase FMO GS-OX4-like [Podarcis lilfordi]|uniref:Flavin-containing monooxygenase n=1 Tax=Podarcis lilfordi TaxID=74358 RepID=A0AA35QQ48_9SAUR|nr:flavin-containing monooxygenase FMO GS-OX4-like [Podarcis lilfordi]
MQAASNQQPGGRALRPGVKGRLALPFIALSPWARPVGREASKGRDKTPPPPAEEPRESGRPPPPAQPDLPQAASAEESERAPPPAAPPPARLPRGFGHPPPRREARWRHRSCRWPWLGLGLLVCASPATSLPHPRRLLLPWCSKPLAAWEAPGFTWRKRLRGGPLTPACTGTSGPTCPRRCAGLPGKLRGAFWGLRSHPVPERVTKHFDAVMVCTGHYANPFIPPIPGLDSFQGRLLHSHSYRRPEPFAGQRVVLAGAGPSGVDLALQLAPLAARVVLSHQGPPVRGLPRDVLQVPPLARVSAETVVPRDGSALPADALILCTGYQYRFPFLDLAQLGLRETEYGLGPLYRHLLAPRHPSLFLVGVCQQICPFPHFHCQALFALAVLKGDCPLPSAAEMEADAQAQLDRHLRQGGLARHFLRLRAQQWSYAEELAHLAGFPPLPPAVREIYEATRASRAQDVSTYRGRNYRLLGPDAWEVVQGEAGDAEGGPLL